ncbi:MAG: anaerobic ribonucleoside-triphosphate reductase, partial [Promethearchaeota archaeon]
GRKPSTKELINPERVHHWAADQLAEEYTLLRILDDEEAKAHLYGDIHIHKLKYFDLRPLSQIWDPRLILKNGIPPVSNMIPCCKSGPANNLNTAIRYLSKWLSIIQSEFCGYHGFHAINTFLAPYIKNLTTEEIYHGIRDLVYELNQLFIIIGRDISEIFISTSPFILEDLIETPAIGPHGKVNGVYGDYNEECLKLFDAITNVFIDGDFLGNSFNFSKHLVFFNEKWLTALESAYSKVWEEIKTRQTPYLLNLCSDWFKDKIKNQMYLSKNSNFGVLQSICLNLPRLAYLSKDEDNYMEILEEKLKFCSTILLKKYNIIKRRLETNYLPFCSGYVNKHHLFNLDNQEMSISFVGLNEAVKFLTNYELHEDSEAFNLGQKIIKRMRKICKELSDKQDKRYSLGENSSMKALERFVRLDLKHFPKFAIPYSKGKSKYYTNSAHFRENIDIDLYEKVIKQGEFHPIMQNLIVEKISLKEFENYKMNLEDFIKKICTESDIACLKFLLK